MAGPGVLVFLCMKKAGSVKNPSIFFKKVDFERAFAIQNGVSVPARMNSTIHTRIVGVVELDVNYWSVPQEQAEEFARAVLSF